MGDLHFHGGPGKGRSDIWVSSASDGKAKPWLATPFAEQNGWLSPDWAWIVYQSNKPGRNEIYVRAFPESDQKWMISTEGGDHAHLVR